MGEASKRSAQRGRIGSTIPKPTRSMTTVVKTIPSGDSRKVGPCPARAVPPPPLIASSYAASMTRATKISAR